MFTVSSALSAFLGFPRVSDPAQVAVVSKGLYQKAPETTPDSGVKVVRSEVSALKALTRGGIRVCQAVWLYPLVYPSMGDPAMLSGQTFPMLCDSPPYVKVSYAQKREEQ